MAQFQDDGSFDFTAGQDAWKQPDSIQQNQYAKGINVSNGGGKLSPRPGYHHNDWVFEDKKLTDIFGYSRSIKELFTTGKFQALIPYFSDAVNYLLVVIGGLVYRVNLNTNLISLLSEDIKLDQYRKRIYWSYAGEYVVLFDYPDYPVVIKGTEIFRSDINHTIDDIPNPQVPISFLGAYNNNRLFIASMGNTFTAGDATGNPLFPEAPITFNEIFTPSSPFVNQQFTTLTDEALLPITAMGFLQEVDSSTGIGPLFVATKRNVFFYNVGQPRSQWGVDSQFGGILLSNVGIDNQRAFANVNSDIVFVSGDGQVHTLSTSRNDFSKWGNVPISREIQTFLKINDPELMGLATVAYFRNKIFISANPYRITALDRNNRPTTDYAHGGMVVLELENMSSLLSESAPAWAGLWTGADVMDMASIDNRCFIMAKHGTHNVLFEMDEDNTYDVVNGSKRRVRSVVYTREYSFEAGAVDKRLNNTTLHIDKLSGNVDLNVEYKPSHAHRFIPYAKWKYFAQTEITTPPTDDFLYGLSNHNLKELVFGDGGIEGCNPITKDLYEVFLSTQVRITIEADYWELSGIKLRAELLPYIERETKELVCDEVPKERLAKERDIDWDVPGVML